MSDTTLIAVFALCFGVLTWLLTMSFFVGRHSARVDALEVNVKKVEANFQTVFSKLDNMAAHLPYHCSQTERLARLELRLELDRPPSHSG